MRLQVREYREEKGLTLDELAEITGITKGYLDKVENCKANWTVKTLKTIAQALEICPHKLVGGCLEIENCENCSYSYK